MDDSYFVISTRTQDQSLRSISILPAKCRLQVAVNRLHNESKSDVSERRSEGYTSSVCPLVVSQTLHSCCVHAPNAAYPAPMINFDITACQRRPFRPN